MSATRLNSPLSILLDKAIGTYEDMERGRLWGAGSILPTAVLGSKLNVLTNARDKMQEAKEQTDEALVGLISELRDPEELQTVGAAIPFDPASDLGRLSKLGILIGILKLCAEFRARVTSFEDIKQRLDLFLPPFVKAFYGSDFHANTVTFVLHQQIVFLQDDIKVKDARIGELEQQTKARVGNTKKKRSQTGGISPSGVVAIVPNDAYGQPVSLSSNALTLSSAIKNGLLALWNDPLKVSSSPQPTASVANDGGKQRKDRTSMALGGG
jgi:hypothetical protein